MHGKLNADQILRAAFHEDWMNENDWMDLKSLLYADTNVSDDKIYEVMRQGEEKGYDFEGQIRLIRETFSGSIADVQKPAKSGN